MDLQIVLPDESPSMPVRALVQIAQAAEALGYSTAWLPDHLLPPEDYGATFGGALEPLVTLGHLTAVTERVRLGTSVLIAPLRDPFLLAKQVATLDRLSDGRVTLGVGVGWSIEEFEALDVDFSARGAITDDVLALLRHLLGGGTAPYSARRFSYERGVFAPVPKRPIPVMVGGGSDAALRRAARYADSWQGLPSGPETFAAQARRVRDLAGPRHVGVTVRIQWDGTTPLAHAVEQVKGYTQAGADAVAVHFGDQGGTIDRLTSLAEALDGE